MPHKFKLRMRYQGGIADDHLLDFYDGATSFQGFSQATHIAVHAYLNREIISKAPALKGAKLFMRPIKQGSLILEIIAVIERYPGTSGFVSAITAPIFYDFIKYVFCKAAGLLSVNPETSYVSEWNRREEPFFEDIAEAMEGSFQRAHRPIDVDVQTITISRPRIDLLTFNSQTKEWVNTREPDEILNTVIGNVTRFNTITGNGRIFIHEIGRIVPFKQSREFPENKKGFLTWSIHGSNLDKEKDISITARYIRSSSGEIKRIILEDCNAINP